MQKQNYVDRDGSSEHQKEILEMKNTVIEMKSAHDWIIIIRLETAEERISELQDMSIETSKVQEQREKDKNMMEQLPMDYKYKH